MEALDPIPGCELHFVTQGDRDYYAVCSYNCIPYLVFVSVEAYTSDLYIEIWDNANNRMDTFSIACSTELDTEQKLLACASAYVMKDIRSSFTERYMRSEKEGTL